MSLLLITSFCPGFRILKILRVSPNSFMEEIVFCLGLGLSSLSLLVLELGLLGLLYDWIFYVLFGVVLIIFYPELWYFLRRLWCAKNKRIPMWIFIPLSFTLFLAIILLLVPTITFDALVYHLAVPQTYIKHHKIIYLPNNCFSNYTFNTEMLFTLGLLLKGDLLAKSIHFLFGLLSALGIYALARRYFGQRTAYWSVLAFCSMPLAVFVATAAFNDFALTFYEILAVYAFINWYHEKNHGWLLVCGLTCGLAIGTKYFGGFCFVILSLSILWLTWRQQGILKGLKTTASFAILVLLPNLPWLIKNLIWTGNPVFPLFYPILGGKNWSQFLYTQYLYEMTRYSQGHHLFLKPFIFLWEISFKQGGGMESGIKLTVGPIFLSLLPFLLQWRKLDFGIKYLLAFCGVFFLFWSYVCAVDRFALPCFVLLCVVVGYTLERFKGKRLYPCLLVILLISLCLNWGYVFKVIHKNAYFMCLKKANTEKFLLEKSIIKDYYDVISWSNRHLPAQSKVLFIGEVRSYYCLRDKLVASQFDTNIILKLIRKSKGIEGLLWNLKQSGVTHVLDNETGTRWLNQYFDYFHWKNNGEKELYNLFRQNYLRLIYVHGTIALFEIQGLDLIHHGNTEKKVIGSW